MTFVDVLALIGFGIAVIVGIFLATVVVAAGVVAVAGHVRLWWLRKPWLRRPQ